MAMPQELVLVRHGESEANVMQNLNKDGVLDAHLPAVYERPDWEQRLSIRGREQAMQAGAWIQRELGGLSLFDMRLMSPYYRTRETAMYLGAHVLPGTVEPKFEDHDWQIDDRLVERHWGAYGTLTLEEQTERFPVTARLKKRDPWYTALDGGESPASGVRLRVRDWLSTLHREAEGKRVLAVTHGEFMWTARQVLERMLPEEWIGLDSDRSQRIRNCSLLQYSRVNPEDPTDINDHMRWMRFVYTDKPEESPYGGEWQEIGRKRQFATEQILAQLALAPPLLVEAVNQL